MNIMKRTKIICTIGPATEEKSKIRGLIKAGMNCARLNFSHGTYEHHEMLIRNIRAEGSKAGEPIAIIQDLQGPRLRLGEFPDDGISVSSGDHVVLSEDRSSKNVPPNMIFLPVRQPIFDKVKTKDIILIKDGLVRMRVERILGDAVVAIVEQGDILTSNRGINLPNLKASDIVITEKDKKDLKFGLKQKVEWVAFSFVRNAEDVEDLRALLSKSNSYCPKIIAKIERKEAVKNFNQIMEASDAIMIARGDLGIEISSKEIPILQKKFIEKCLISSKPVIVATQMLESMTINSAPTRAEVSDVANAVIDHADALMLSSETSTGKYPVASCQVMRDIIEETESSPYDDEVASRRRHRGVVPSIVAGTAEGVSKHKSVKAIVVMSSSGKSAQLISSERPQVPIFALTQNEITLRQMSLVWGVRPYILPRQRNVDDLISESVRLVKKEIKVKKGDKIVIATGHPTGPHGSLNLIKVHTI